VVCAKSVWYDTQTRRLQLHTERFFNTHKKCGGDIKYNNIYCNCNENNCVVLLLKVIKRNINFKTLLTQALKCFAIVSKN
jgi:hypothetical protein